MRTLSPTEWLAVWERGCAEPPPGRAIALLEAACDDLPPGEINRLSIGRRDDRLLTLRESLMGPRLEALANCPKCGERLEIELAVADLRTPPRYTVPDELVLAAADFEVRFRPPNQGDLAVLSPSDDPDTNQSRLLGCSLISAKRKGTVIPTDELPKGLLDVLAEKIVEADPQADVQLSFNCPVCRHSWQETFDIVSFLWAEIHAWALRLMSEVHLLASAYGWSEAEILALSAPRRRVYCELLGA